MAYRSASPPREQPSRAVPYGRFGPTFIEVLLTLCFLVLGTAAVMTGLFSSETFVCTREAGAVQCVFEKTHLWGDRRWQLSGDQIAAVEWVPYTGSKRAERGKTEIFDRTGRPLTVASGPRDEARASYERIAAFFADDSQRRVEVADETSWVVWLIGPGLLLVGLLMGRAAFRRPTSVRLVIHPSRHAVEVVERWLGVPMRRRELSLERVERVEVERGFIKRLHHRTYHQGDPAGFLVLRYEGGASAPVTGDLLAGTVVHDRAAEALRREAGVVSARRASSAASSAEAPPPAPAPERPHSSRKVLKWWLSSIAVVSVIGFGIEFLITSGDGRLHVQCEHRCRFDGFDCRPGGEVAMSKEPGDHVVEVFDPDHPDGWRPVTVSVREGETTTFRCR